jgi:hypothetical protein
MSEERKVFDKRRTLAFLGELDDELVGQGYQRKLSLYCAGGTKMVLSGLRHGSVDLDFMLSRQDFRVLGGYVVEYFRKHKLRLDLFPEGEMPGYSYPDFRDNAVRALFKFRRFDLYYIDDVDFVITKALAGRQKDREDIDAIFSVRKIPKAGVLERYQKIRFAPDKEEELRGKFEEFISNYYVEGEDE